MRHMVDGRKFGRNTSHRVAMLKNLANNVILKEQIVTTVQKAKEARRVVDRLVTLGKEGSVHSRRLAFARSRNDMVVGRLFDELAKRYAGRAGGYTRILKVSDRRWGDAAEMAILELVDHPVIDRKKKVKAEKATPSEGAESADAVAAQPKDPFGKFRKMFQTKTKGAKGASAGKSQSRSSAARKTPSASNKAGGSSS